MKLKVRVWNGEQMIIPDRINNFVGEAIWYENSIPQVSKDIMLYTGVKDKTNKEICQNDIIKNAIGISIVKFGEFRDDLNKFEYDNHRIGFYHEDIETKERYPFGKPIKKSLYKILGNTYANPELLKGVKDGQTI
jgi:hypothetical protein